MQFISSCMTENLATGFYVFTNGIFFFFCYVFQCWASHASHDGDFFHASHDGEHFHDFNDGEFFHASHDGEHFHAFLDGELLHASNLNK